MATAKKRRRRKNTKRDNLIVYSILAAIFFAGFFVGRITKQPETIIVPTVEETVLATEVEKVVEPETIVIEETEPEEQIVYFDCPLDEELQDYIFELCEEEEIPPSLVIAIIDHESEFTADVVSSTKDYGLMQINECNHEWLSETYGITDFLDPKENILAGVKILGTLYRKYEDPHEILMAYNMGEWGAKDAWEQGILTTPYSEEVTRLWYMYEVDHEMEVQRGKQID